MKSTKAAWRGSHKRIGYSLGTCVPLCLLGVGTWGRTGPLTWSCLTAYQVISCWWPHLLHASWVTAQPGNQWACPKGQARFQPFTSPKGWLQISLTPTVSHLLPTKQCFCSPNHPLTMLAESSYSRSRFSNESKRHSGKFPSRYHSVRIFFHVCYL